MNYHKLAKFENEIVVTKQSKRFNKIYAVDQAFAWWDPLHMKGSHKDYETFTRLIKNIRKFKDRDASLYIGRLKKSEHYRYNKRIRTYIDDFITKLNSIHWVHRNYGFGLLYDYFYYNGSDGRYYINKDNIIKFEPYESVTKKIKRPENIEYSSDRYWHTNVFKMIRHDDGSLIQEINGLYFFRHKEVKDTWVGYKKDFLPTTLDINTRYETVYHKGKQLNKKELKKYGYLT